LISKKSVFDKRKNNLSLENIIAKEGISILWGTVNDQGYSKTKNKF
jgi:hypothetical protein